MCSSYFCYIVLVVVGRYIQVHLSFRSMFFSETDHRWNDVIMIPEYLNHIEAGLYLWSALWYPHENCDYFGYYTLTIHKIETVAAFVELFASFGW